MDTWTGHQHRVLGQAGEEGKGALLWLLNVTLHSTDASIPISKVVSRYSRWFRCETNMQKFDNTPPMLDMDMVIMNE